MGGQVLTEKENGRLQSPLSSSSSDGHGRENTSCGGVSIALLYQTFFFYKAILKITAIALYEIAMKSIITIYSYGLVGYKRYILILQCQDD